MKDGILKRKRLEETSGAGTGRTAMTKARSEINHLGRREVPVWDGERFVPLEETLNKAFK
ncbi:MAG: hypothetical protein R3B09_08865 [Nannocystaceae bacterium]